MEILHDVHVIIYYLSMYLICNHDFNKRMLCICYVNEEKEMKGEDQIVKKGKEVAKEWRCKKNRHTSLGCKYYKDLILFPYVLAIRIVKLVIEFYIDIVV